VQVTMTLQRTLLAWITAIKSARELCPIVEGPLCCGENLQSTETATCNLLPSRHIMLLVVSTYRALSRCRALRPSVTVTHIQWISVSLKPLLQRRVRQIAGHTLSICILIAVCVTVCVRMRYRYPGAAACSAPRRRAAELTMGYCTACRSFRSN